MRSKRTMALVVGLCTVATPVVGQTPTIAVPDGPACARCTIGVQRLVSLGDADGPGSLPGIPTVRIDSRGRYWALVASDLPIVFDANGKFMRVVGAKGSGPGEFQMPRDGFSIPGDSFIVLDGRLRRATVFSPDLRAARSFALSQGFSWVVPIQWPDRAVAYGADAVQSLQRIAFSSDSVRVLGAFGPTRASRADVPLALQAARASNGAGIWSSSVPGYQLQQWTTDGVLLRTMARSPAWFPSTSMPSIGWADKPPTPGVAAIQQAPDGLLWVFINVPSPEWRQAWPALVPGATHIEGNKIAREYLYRTTVEVIDPVAGRVVARRALEEWIVNALPNGRAAAYSVDANGTPRVGILQLTLVGR